MNYSVYQFELIDIDGNPLKLSAYKGKKILLVNTASECGYTPQYSQLEELHKEFVDRLVVVGIPSNDFGGQEPRGNKELKEFCSLNYGVTFLLTSKVSILGNEIHPLYKFLTTKSLNNFADSEVKWNFQKYLCDEEGKLIAVFPHNMEPLSEDILKAIDIPHAV